MASFYSRGNCFIATTVMDTVHNSREFFTGHWKSKRISCPLCRGKKGAKTPLICPKCRTTIPGGSRALTAVWVHWGHHWCALGDAKKESGSEHGGGSWVGSREGREPLVSVNTMCHRSTAVVHWLALNAQPEAKSIPTVCAGQRPITNLLSPLSCCLTRLQIMV